MKLNTLFPSLKHVFTWSCLIQTVVLVSGAFADMGPLKLTEDSKPAASIVISHAPTVSAVMGAIELRDHVQKITGATLPIVPDTVKVNGTRVLIGQSAATDALGFKNDDFKTQEFMVTRRGNDLVLFGRDMATPYVTTKQGGMEIIGKPKAVEGRFGKALSFDGEHDAMRLKPIDFDDKQGSIELWFKLADGWKGDGVLVRLDGSEPWTYQIINVTKDGTLVYVTFYENSGSGKIATGELKPGWHHVLATWDAAKGQQELFLDGSSVGKAPYKATTCSKAQVQIGAMCVNAMTQYTGGQIDEVRFSKVVRSPEGWDKTAPSMDDDTLLLLNCDEASGIPAPAIRDFGDLSITVPMFGSSQILFFQDHGSCDAVHEFLERDCGVRWYAPTDLGMEHPRQPSLAVKVTEVRRTPAIECRFYRLEECLGYGRVSSTNKFFDVLNHPDQLQACLWMLRNKFGGKPLVANHGLYSFYDRFWEKNPQNPNAFEGSHPEYFAQGYKGLPPQLCYTNPAVIEQVSKDIIEYFQTGKSKVLAAADWASVEPMDNDYFCKCENCRKWFPNVEPGEKRSMEEVFMSGKYSDYMYHFANEVQKRVGEVCPEAHIFVLAYASHGMPPSFPVDPRIYTGTCVTPRYWFAPSDPSAFQAWVEKEAQNPRTEIHGYQAWARENKTSGRVISMWLYDCFPLSMGDWNGWRAFPGFNMRALANVMQMFARDGVKGLFACGIGEQLETYISLKYADDPNREIEPLLDEFFAQYYGPAGVPMKNIYNFIEETYNNKANYPPEFVKIIQHQTEEIAWKYLGTKDRMDKIAGWIKQAQDAKLTDIQRQRVEIFVEGPWAYMQEGRRAWLNKSEHQDEMEALKKTAPPTAHATLASSAGGDLSKIDWSKAGHTVISHIHEGYPSERQITVDIAYDVDYFYIRAVDPIDSRQVRPAGSHFDGDRWEIFLGAQTAKAQFIQLGIKADGRLVTLAYPGCHEVHGSGAMVKCTLDDKGWTTELAIPLKLIQSFDGFTSDKVYMNLYRAGAGGASAMAWSPNFLGSGFNSSSRLGAVTLDK
ncbi:MAG: DUF4838 domain-containing protein [Phycisphaeraceae bacterium]|nr:DUF4838 domain-containing protein [Phycisphaeraceae bacterium]